MQSMGADQASVALGLSFSGAFSLTEDGAIAAAAAARREQDAEDKMSFLKESPERAFYEAHKDIFRKRTTFTRV